MSSSTSRPKTLEVIKAAEAAGIANDVLWAASTPVERHDLRQGGREVLERQDRRQRRARRSSTGRARTRRSTAPCTTSTRNKWGKSTFGQFGFLDARVAAEALLDDEAEPDHREDRQRGVPRRSRTGGATCSAGPWYYGKLPGHVPSNAGPDRHAEGRQDGAGRGLLRHRAQSPPRSQARQAEKKFGLTSGTPFPPPAWQR